MSEIEKVTRELLAQDFDLESTESTHNLSDQLTSAVIWLLMNDLTRLWNILYRIDVNEKKVKDLFAQNDPERIAPGLAHLILERIKQKAESRIRYRS